MTNRSSVVTTDWKTSLAFEYGQVLTRVMWMVLSLLACSTFICRSIDKAYYRYRKVLANERHLMENL